MADKFSRRKLTGIHVTSKVSQDYVNRELADPKNKNFQKDAGKHIRNTVYKPMVEEFYREMIESISDYFTDKKVAPDGGSSFTSPFSTYNEIRAPHRPWRALSRNYLKRKSNSKFLHNTGSLASAIPRLIPTPKGKAIRSTSTVVIKKSTSKRQFRAEVSVYIAHKLGDPSLTDYVNRAFTRGQVHGNKFHGNGDEDLGKLVMFETGR